jgi:hypothetical protein
VSSVLLFCVRLLEPEGAESTQATRTNNNAPHEGLPPPSPRGGVPGCAPGGSLGAVLAPAGASTAQGVEGCWGRGCGVSWRGVLVPVLARRLAA